MKYECLLTFESPHSREIVKAITFEDPYERTEIVISNEKDKVFIKIRSKDITALKAAFNEYLRLIKVCEIEGV
jgi:tRNA threonylcarbamoyladenosine modification (KEOPS) complex  Pcc1 subunit